MNSDTPRTEEFREGDSLLESWEQEWEAAITFARQLERELAASQAEVERLKENAQRIGTNRYQEINTLQSQLKRAIEIAEMFSQVKGLHYQCNCRSCQMFADLKGEIK
jgi:hypothetical protein